MFRQKTKNLPAKMKSRRRCASRSFIGSSYARRLHVETLEDRRLLAVFSVDNLNDSGAGSLRDAIGMANTTVGSDQITFSVTGTIVLASQLPTITDDLTITGPGQELLTLDAGDGTDDTFATLDGYRIFDIDDGNPSSNLEVTISDLTLTGSDLPGEGGSILSRENLTVANSIISGNSATFGGGILNAGGNLTVRNSTIGGNSAALSGGGILNDGTTHLVDSTIAGNQASNGGGVFNYSGTTTIVNSTLSGNSASGEGGGVFNSSNPPYSNPNIVNIYSSTISGNMASFGGGISNREEVTLNNTIVAKNTASNYSPDIDSFGPENIITGNFNLIGDGSGQFDLVNGFDGNQVGDAGSPIDPLLASLADNGGATQTHALLSASPAINFGDFFFDPNVFTPPLVNDQRGPGFNRVSGAAVDIGAFESQPFDASLLIVTTTVDELDFTNNEVSLREAITSSNENAGADVITFSLLFDTPQTIDLGSQLPTITDDLTINGPGADLLTLDAGDGADNTFGTGDGYRVIGINGFVAGGGGISVELRDLTVTGGDVAGLAGEDLLTFDEEGNGGGIASTEAGLTLERLQIKDNFAFGSGGGVDFSSDYGASIFDFRLAHSSITGNSALGTGGGFAIYGAPYARITTSTISENTATSIIFHPRSGGGGAISDTGLFLVSGSTITGNRGGGFLSGPASVEVVHTIVSHTIIAGNTIGFSGSPDFSDLHGFVNFNFDLDHSLIGSNEGTTLTEAPVGSPDINGNLIGTFANPIDPLLGPLADNGGPTPTHALLPGSPAIDAGVGSVPGATGPTSLYQFEETSTLQAAADAVGSLDGVYQGSVQLEQPTAPGLFGSAAKFDNDPANFIEVIAPGGLPASGLPTSELTVETWVNLDSFVSFGGIAAAAVDNGTEEAGWYFVSRDTQSFAFFLRTDGGGPGNVANTLLETTTLLETGKWYHVVATYDGATARLYVDGIQQASIAQAGDIVYPTTNDSGFVIGKYRDSNDNNPFDGTIDELGIYDRALSPEEVAFHALQGTLDQRGLPRVANGGIALRQDIGAFEVQAAPSADFDTDGDVDGADFLAWQRGFGTQIPNATLADGDADNDQDVDAADLGIWQGQFGSSALPLAASSAGSLKTAAPDAEQALTPPEATSVQNAFSASLIDAAFTAEWLGDVTGEEESPVQDDHVLLESVFSTPPQNVDITITATRTTEHEPIVSSSGEEAGTNNQWLTEELLEKVFGSPQL